ncbi:uncharacterized protein LOC114574484 [Exaiptasia diaphana]|uniref:Uncharacterized protein n=1 Tax=Exaiptasia diaphana TaxID=2652724 RepID=A0A913YCG6_EXADI|nr:uncharacterized protein LOC114574484 [Exaiptasia diaphana]
MSNKKNAVYNTRQRHSHPLVHPYEQAKKQNKSYRIGDDTISLIHQTGPCSQSSSNCIKCNALLQGLNCPVGSYIQGEIFTKAVRQMQERNSFSNTHKSSNSLQAPSPPTSKKPDGFCESCHELEFELCNNRHAQGQFCLSALSRTSNQATNESPDYVAFQGKESHASQTQCNKCFSLDGHLRNSLIRDMRNYYGTQEWQDKSKDLGDCYANKDGIPYAPFAVEPSSFVQKTFSCARCKEMCSDSFKSDRLRNEWTPWNPYPMKDSFDKSTCRRCSTRGLVCNGCRIWSFD